MKILIVGANGYIGSRLLLLLSEAGHEVIALVRHATQDSLPSSVQTFKADLLQPDALKELPKDIDVAFYLVHAMSYGKDFADKESQIVENFLAGIRATQVKQVIYLGGLYSDKNLSPHLASRLKTERKIIESAIPYTVLRAGIIIGSGSASYEIIRDLVEKLPVMVAPKWVRNLCQPISIRDVLRYLMQVMNDSRCINRVFDIGGPDQLSYKDILLVYAKVRHLKRYIFVVPVLTPRLSSYWLYFITSVNFSLAQSLVDSLKNNAICHDEAIKTIFPQPCLTYEESIKETLDLIEQNPFVPSWKDAMIAPELETKLASLIHVPTTGCFIDQQRLPSKLPKEVIIDKIWMMGGDSGWHFMNWAWQLRGFIDKLVGGVGLQRGRSSGKNLRAGSTLDFWRVIAADKEKGYLLLYAEMKLPGEAWLEFSFDASQSDTVLIQTASFRPKGLFGYFYWYALFPFHYFIFRGLAKSLVN